MGQVDYEGYRRRVSDFAFKAKRRDVPRDVERLLELVREVELVDKFIVDREYWDV